MLDKVYDEPSITTDEKPVGLLVPEADARIFETVKNKLLSEDVDLLLAAHDDVERTKAIQKRQDEFLAFIQEFDNDEAKSFLETLDKVLDFYSGQKRKNGEPVIYHMLNVAKIMKNDLRVNNLFYLKVALLHDINEDAIEMRATKVSPQNSLAENLALGSFDLKMDGDTQVAVSGLTKFKHFDSRVIPRGIVTESGKIAYRDEVYEMSSFMNLLFAAEKYPGILYVKIADRLHNLRTSDGLKEKKKAELSRETKDFYIPLARRLKLEKVVEEMERVCGKLDSDVGYELPRMQVEDDFGDGKNHHEAKFLADEVAKALATIRYNTDSVFDVK